MALSGLLRPWDRRRTLHRCAGWIAVDKPAYAPLRSEAGDDDNIVARVATVHPDAGELSWAPPERASGVSLIGCGRRKAPEVVEWSAIAAFDEPTTPPEAPPAGWGLRLETLRQQGDRRLVRVTARRPPEQVLAELRRLGWHVVGGAGGPPATRCFLHIDLLILGGGPRLLAPPGPEFEVWLRQGATAGPGDVEGLLREAGLSRWAIARRFEAFRLLGEGSGEVGGLSLDCYGQYGVLAVSSQEALECAPKIATCLVDHGLRGVYLKRRVREDARRSSVERTAPNRPLAGDPSPDACWLRMGDVALQARISEGLSTGLFLDQRANWARMAERGRGGSLLNLFCYTGAFTVAAAQGGAEATVSVDLSGRALSRLSDNLRHQSLAGPRHRVLKGDVLPWLQRARRRGARFDAIVLDPPSFGTRAKGVLRVDRDFPQLATDALSLLQPGGCLLAVLHHRQVDDQRLEDWLGSACDELDMSAELRPWVGDWDCATVPGVSTTRSILVRRKDDSP